MNSLLSQEGDPIVLAILSSRDKKDADYIDKLIAETTKEVIKPLKNKNN